MNSYTPNINRRNDFLLQGYLQQKKIYQEFISIINQRADAEQVYSKELEKVGENLETFSNHKELDPNLSALILSLRSTILTHSEQGIQLIDLIKKDIVQLINNLLNNQQNQIKNFNQMAKDYDTKLKQSINNLESEKQKYYSVIYEGKLMLEKIKNEQQQSQNNELNQQIQEQFNIQEQQINQQQEQQAGQLKQTVINYNKFLEDYFSKIAEMNEVYIKQETDRQDLYKDSITKYVIYQISYIKNVEYDLNNISKKIEAYQRKLQIEGLKELDGKTFLSVISYDNLIHFLQTEYQNSEINTRIYNNVYNINKSNSNINDIDLKNILQEGIKKVSQILNNNNIHFPPKQEETKQQLEEQSKKYCENLINQIINENKTLDGQQIIDFKDMMKKDYSRKAFNDNIQKIVILQFNELNQESVFTNLLHLISLYIDALSQNNEDDLLIKCLKNFKKICEKNNQPSKYTLLMDNKNIQNIQNWVQYIQKLVMFTTGSQIEKQQQQQEKHLKQQIDNNLQLMQKYHNRLREIDLSKEFCQDIFQQFLEDQLQIDKELLEELKKKISEFEQQRLKSIEKGRKKIFDQPSTSYINQNIKSFNEMSKNTHYEF